VFDINGGEFLVILLVAVIVVGPTRLPHYAEQLGRMTRQARRYLTEARERVGEELGEDAKDIDWEALDPRRYDPRRIVRDALMDTATGSPAGPRTAPAPPQPAPPPRASAARQRPPQPPTPQHPPPRSTTRPPSSTPSLHPPHRAAHERRPRTVRMDPWLLRRRASSPGCSPRPTPSTSATTSAR
jgi:sec-independent protein translocase protein TatB